MTTVCRVKIKCLCFSCYEISHTVYCTLASFQAFSGHLDHEKWGFKHTDATCESIFNTYSAVQQARGQ